MHYIAPLKGEHAKFCIVCQFPASLTQDEDSKLGSIAICADRVMVNRRLAQGLGRAYLTNRWSGRVKDKVPSSYIGARAAQLNR